MPIYKQNYPKLFKNNNLIKNVGYLKKFNNMRSIIQNNHPNLVPAEILILCEN